MNALNKLTLLAGLMLAASVTHAAGPLILSDETGTLKPVVWNTGNGPIPVYTDGGEVFTFDYDGITPFVTIERANQITAQAFREWSQVPTSTFEATIQGTIESKTGVADVTSANVADFIGVENGPGFWVIYDTDGSIMEDFFGVDRNSVLGISSPEFGDGQGHIIESWTVMNGWAVDAGDTGADAGGDPDVIFHDSFEPLQPAKRFAGVFTHEIGHAINLSHSQVNGSMVYDSYPGMEHQPGIKGCVAPLYSYNAWGVDPDDIADPSSIETMYPFIDSSGTGGEQQASVNASDDITGISNLYPTAAYLAGKGSISGTLYLKDGTTPYAGINVIARNVANPLLDAVSDMSGSASQGLLGPDGHFRINGLEAGASYVLYIEEIMAGGYPTTPQAMASEGEYWNTAESSNPATDGACLQTPIAITAGGNQQANIIYNGFDDGVSFTPVVYAYLTSLSTHGTRAGGTAGAGEVALIWRKGAGIEVLPDGVGSYNGSIDGFGTRMAVQADSDGNGIRGPGIWHEDGSITVLDDLNGNTCGGSNQSGSDSAIAMGMDKSASTVVGLAYIDRDGNGSCEGPDNEIVPFMWTQAGGTVELAHDPDQYWTRANTVSGNGRVVLGTSNFQNAWAWIDGANPIDLLGLFGSTDANAVNFDGSVVALDTMDVNDYRDTGVVLWNPLAGTGPGSFSNIAGLRYCIDLPYLNWGVDMCADMTAQEIFDQVGYAPVNVFGVNDAGTVAIGRAGDFFSGTSGAMWIKDVGWMVVSDFLRHQGVVEASNTPIDNPLAISGNGSTIMGGVAGLEFTWLIDLTEVYVCKNGQSIRTSFPNGLRAEVMNGAEVGRCEFIP